MVSQFVSTHEVPLLSNLPFDFPEGTHAIGRLDNYSEGLLILTTNKKITRLLFQSPKPHLRTYLALVTKQVSEEELDQLKRGVNFRIRGGGYYTSIPCEAAIVDKPAHLFDAPIVMSDKVVYTWLRISLTEGKFHQVRKMITAIHHRCIRLIRVSIENLKLGNLQPGCIKEIGEDDFFELLKLDEAPIAAPRS